jgi:hypothetical protein
MAEIDFKSADSRMKYLQEHLGHLMKGIDSNYSSVMMSELVRRLEKTVSDFNDEVKAMLSKLQGDDSGSTIMGSQPPPVSSGSVPPPSDEGDVLSAFEKKLKEVEE